MNHLLLQVPKRNNDRTAAVSEVGAHGGPARFASRTALTTLTPSHGSARCAVSNRGDSNTAQHVSVVCVMRAQTVHVSLAPILLTLPCARG